MPETKALSVIDGKSLLALDCEPPKFIVSRILPVGLSILSGSPKVGKSWLALWLCQQISKGDPVWEFETLKSTVLYLALEDTVDRLHFRLSRITEDGSDDSYFATQADSISGELITQLETFTQQRPDTGIIVIDTLQRIRGSGDDTKSGYSFDYQDMNKIKAVADRLKIAILLIHHTRKLPDSDPFNTISGSTGLTGSADTMLVLEKDKRTENKAKLHITGRDVEDLQLNLSFDRDTMVWQFISFETGEENPAKDIITALMKFVSVTKTFSGTASELLEKLKEIETTITLTPNALTRSIRENILTLEKRHNINISFKRTNEARTITLSIGDGDDGFSATPAEDISDGVSY